MEREIGEFNTHIFIFEWFENRLMEIPDVLQIVVMNL